MTNYVVGIDEAGRGPLLGSMVYAGVMWPANFEKENTALTGLGLTDSKLMTEKQRNRAFEALQHLEEQGKLFIEVREVTPLDISHATFTLKKSLNQLSEECAFDIVQSFVNRGFSISKVVLDTVGPPEAYHSRISKHFAREKLQFAVEVEADRNHRVVSAASVVAKVTRDRLLHDWKCAESVSLTDRDWENGYVVEKAVAWLGRNCHPVFGFTDIVRWSWSTTEDHARKHMVSFRFASGKRLIDDPVLLQQLRHRHKPYRVPEDRLRHTLREKLSFDTICDLID